jgi:glycine cleavage system H lipoate-binding protein
MKKRRTSARRRPQFSGLLEELEPRLLFNADAAALTGGLDPLLSDSSPAAGAQQVQTQTPTSSTTAQQSEATAEVSASTQVIAKPVELVFVDSSVKDAQELVASIVAQQDGSRTLEIHWLDSSQDGVTQITDVLRERQNVTALHLVTHGKDGVLQLGSTLLDAANLHDHASRLSEWGLSLSADADLMIYGCDVAATAEGQRFVSDIGLLTSADIAASIDDTGARNLGGDWVLEYQAGQIQTASLIQQPAANEWQGLLGLISSGGETIAHTATGGTTESTLTNRQVASDSSGNFVVVYQSGTTLKLQRFNADGTMNGAALTVASTGTPTNAQVAMNATGAFVVVWNDASGNLIFRTYTNTSVAGTATTVAAVTSASEGYPFYSATVTTTQVNGTVGINSAGEFVIAWREHRDVAPDVPWYAASVEDTIKWKAYTAAGAAQGSNGSGNVSSTADGHAAPSIGMNGAGAFVVSYSDSSGNIYARRYSAARVAQGAGAADITGSTGGTQSSAAMDSSGNYVIAYNDAGVIKFRMYNSAGTNTTAVITANSIAAGTPNSPSASMDASGNFTLVWQNSGQDGGGNGVYIRTFNGSGVAAAADARVNTTTAGNQQAASVVVTGSTAVAVWSGNGTGDTAGVFFQRYALPNTAPTLTATASNPAFTEAAGSGTQAGAVAVYSGTAVSTTESGQTITSLTFTVSGIVNGANERIAVDGTTITLGADSAGTTATNGMGYTVTMAGGTATVVLTKGSGITSAATQTLVNGITYQNTNTDDPTAGNRVFTLTQIKDSGGTASGGVDTRVLAIASTVAVASRNDAPTLTATSLNPTFTEAAGSGTQASAVNVFSGTAVGTVESADTITSLTFTVSGLANGVNESIVVDGTTITLGANSSGSTATNGMTYNVTIAGSTATITLTKAAGISTAATQTLVDSITYQNTSTDNPTAGNRVFTLTQIKDSGGTANAGSDTTTLSRASTVSVVAVNDAPTLSTTALNPSFTEAAGVGTQASAVNVFSGTSASAVETGQTLTSLTFTISGILDGASERISIDGVTITLGANSSGTTSTNAMGYNVTVAGGTATITLTKAAGISAANMQTLVNGITYQNTNTDNPNSGGRVFTLTQVKDNGGTTNGGNDTTTLSTASTVTVASVNDAPTLTATALNPSFTEAAGANTQAAAVSVFSGAAASTIETGQALTSLTFTVSGITNGASERIVVDGSAITLGANSSGTTATNGMTYNVTIAGGTATVTLTKAAGISTAVMQTLVNGITYQNTNRDDPTAGNRVFTLTQVTDNGGTANGGNDTTTLAVASTVAVVTRNDAPTLTTTALNPTFTEAAGVGTQASAVNVFSGTAVSTVESGQTVTSLTFTLSGIVNGASERIVVDGRAITLGANSSGTTVTNGMNYNVTIASGTATVTLTKAAGITAAATQTLVNGITYQNISTDNPTSGNRVFTLTQIKDSGGTANSGSDTTTLTAASTVTVNAVNDAPILTATASNPAFTEQAGAGTQAAAVGIFSGAAVGTIESGQTITSLSFTVAGLLDGNTERIVVDGTAITLGANSSGTTATNAMSYSVNISGGTATVTLTKGAAYRRPTRRRWSTASPTRTPAPTTRPPATASSPSRRSRTAAARPMAATTRPHWPWHPPSR